MSISGVPIDDLAAVLGQPGDHGGAREVAGRVAAHAVGDREDRRLRDEAVLVDLAAEPSVGHGGPGDRDLGAVGQHDAMPGVAVADLRHGAACCLVGFIRGASGAGRISMIVSSPRSRLLPGATTIDSPARIRREPEAPRTIVPFVDFSSVATRRVPSSRSSRWVPDTTARGDGTVTSCGAPPAASGMRGASGRRPMRTRPVIGCGGAPADAEHRDAGCRVESAAPWPRHPLRRRGRRCRSRRRLRRRLPREAAPDREAAPRSTSPAAAPARAAADSACTAFTSTGTVGVGDPSSRPRADAAQADGVVEAVDRRPSLGARRREDGVGGASSSGRVVGDGPGGDA